MKPSSRMRRKAYFYSLSFAFVLLIPVIILYASGYRLTNDWKILSTGAIYIHTPYSGSSIFVDGEFVKETSILQKSVLLQNLEEGNHFVEVKKDGYRAWSKNFEVERKFVSEGYAFLVRSDLVREEVSKFLDVTGASSTPKLNLQYQEVMALFEDTVKDIKVSLDPILSGKEGLATMNNVGIWKDGNKILAGWFGNTESIPIYFCKHGCYTNLLVLEAEGPISHLYFYPERNDVIIFSIDNVIYAVEIDERTPRTTHLLYTHEGFGQFRVFDDKVYIQEGTNLYRLKI